MNCIDNRLQFLCALRSCSFAYLRVLQFVRVSEMFPNSACWPQSSSVALCNAYRMRCCECQYNFHLSTRPPTEGKRESTYYTIYRILWLPSRLEFSTIFSQHLTVWIFQAAKEQSYREQAVRPQTEQTALLWKQIQAEYLNEKWSFCLSRVAGSWGHIDRETETRMSASGVREDRHSAVRNFRLAQTHFLDVILKVARENRPTCKVCMVMLSHILTVMKKTLEFKGYTTLFISLTFIHTPTSVETRKTQTQ